MDAVFDRHCGVLIDAMIIVFFFFFFFSSSKNSAYVAFRYVISSPPTLNYQQKQRDFKKFFNSLTRYMLCDCFLLELRFYGPCDLKPRTKLGLLLFFLKSFYGWVPAGYAMHSISF